MSLWSKFKEMFAWNRIVVFLKVIFKGTLLLLIDALKDLAVEVAREVANKDLPTDGQKREEFAKIMKSKAEELGYELKDSVLNLLREQAVAYIKAKV